jgi:hypothetical protein
LGAIDHGDEIPQEAAVEVQPDATRQKWRHVSRVLGSAPLPSGTAAHAIAAIWPGLTPPRAGSAGLTDRGHRPLAGHLRNTRIGEDHAALEAAAREPVAQRGQRLISKAALATCQIRVASVRRRASRSRDQHRSWLMGGGPSSRAASSLSRCVSRPFWTAGCPSALPCPETLCRPLLSVSSSRRCGGISDGPVPSYSDSARAAGVLPRIHVGAASE